MHWYGNKYKPMGDYAKNNYKFSSNMNSTLEQMRKKWSILKFSLSLLHSLKDPVQITIHKAYLNTHMLCTTHWFFNLSLKASPARLEPLYCPEGKKKNFFKRLAAWMESRGNRFKFSIRKGCNNYRNPAL